MTILDTIRRRATEHPQKPAIITLGEEGWRITYAWLIECMESCKPLPIPLLGETWNGSFHLTTTGTTGQEKTVIISQKAVIANSENLIEAQGYNEDTVFVIAGAITHLGSWSKIFPTLMMGGTIIVLPDIKDMNLFFKALDYPSQHLATFLVPAAIRMLLQFSRDRLAEYADKIEFLETGAAPISSADMQSLCKTLPKTRLYNTYASTETGIVATYNYNDGQTRECCVGKPLRRSGVKLDTDGRIICTGDTLMDGYLDNQQLTETVLHDGELYTADYGHFDTEGRLYIDGRIDDVLNIGGYKINPVEVENAAMGHPDITDCMCISTEHKVFGPMLKLLVKMEDGKTLDRHSLARHILSKLERYKVPQLYEEVTHIQRTFNGKLKRTK